MSHIKHPTPHTTQSVDYSTLGISRPQQMRSSDMLKLEEAPPPARTPDMYSILPQYQSVGYTHNAKRLEEETDPFVEPIQKHLSQTSLSGPRKSDRVEFREAYREAEIQEAVPQPPLFRRMSSQEARHDSQNDSCGIFSDNYRVHDLNGSAKRSGSYSGSSEGPTSHSESIFDSSSRSPTA
ncbi:hypothetical protein BABINDRAFT_164844 [Babjeviella inositovora NRRL Y-12698]|uniref:Uncharacterized protein n=1 Tax=Babjeviella inositovora NRRL Y-12698 TaxID=984486 RepID=A0A1E3QZM5_9ASCO|nr:uncharacterized protein BABINDRAFT_164844 [Babjeviella inositovora NRRL Y-12698]ODQ83139.1 hypothetical protein BABINDRAFT_164844 [Babjeviella inositovora NRRL Y-12698]